MDSDEEVARLPTADEEYMYDMMDQEIANRSPSYSLPGTPQINSAQNADDEYVYDPQEDIDTEYQEYEFHLPEIGNQPSGQPEQPEQPANQPEQPANQPEQPEQPQDSDQTEYETFSNMAYRGRHITDRNVSKILEKYLDKIYDTKASKRVRNLLDFEKKIADVVKERGNNDNLFIIYYLKDLTRPDDKPYLTVQKYIPEDFTNFTRMTISPEFAWEYWRDSSLEQLSDIPNLLSSDTHVWVPWALRIFDPLDPKWPESMTEEERELLDNLFVTVKERVQGRRRTGRFMKWGLNMKKLYESNSPAAICIKNLQNTDFLEKDLQIPWFTKFNNPLKEDNEGEDPIQNEIYRIPCLLYALKSQVCEECYKELEASKKLTARGAKITQIKNILTKYNYKVTQYAIEYQKQNKYFFVRNRTYKGKEEGTEIKVMFWEDHWMQYREVLFEDKQVCFIKVLETLKNEGLLFPYNVFDMAKEFQCFSFDSMLHWKPEKVQELIKSTLENGYEFTEKDWDKPEYHDPKAPPKVIFFADFEATTDEKYHVPFLICGKGYYMDERGFTKENEIEIHGKSDGFIIEWGTDSARKFLDMICKNVYTNRGQNKRNPQPIARVYFYNLKYDITFILPYLTEINKIEKDGRIYSCTGFYTHLGCKIFFDFWDAYPIFQSTLAGAGKSYLTEEEKKTIRKEAFPYKTYTYKFFNDHMSQFKEGAEPAAELYEFENDPNFKAFADTINEDLVKTGMRTSSEDGWSITESNFATKRERSREEEEIQIDGELMTTTRTTITEEKIWVKWQAYAEFYCCQDVRILCGIMNNMKNLMKADGCEGIHGTPPFSQDLLRYRTSSSLSYDYFLKTVIFDKTEDGWISKHNIVFPKGLLRYLIQLTVRGGRVMCRDNQKWHYTAKCCDDYLQDYDAVSLYPSAMSRLWISEGIPKFLKGEYSEVDFKRDFCDPEDDENKEKKPYTDGCIHLTMLYTRKPRHFPLLCIKDKRTGLNDYKNYNGSVDTWVNAIDLYNLIDFQDAVFKWDMAVVWSGPRHFEIRKSITDLFEFRKANHGKGVEHPIQNVAKVMMNSIYGKSVLKASDKKKITLDITKKIKNKETGKWEDYNYWEKWFKANMYRIHSFEPTEGNHVSVTIYCRDMSHSFNIFGSNVLAMARRMIGRVMALGEDLEEKFPQFSPGIFYTDTDSMHIRQDLLKELVSEFKKKYGWEIMGSEMCQFHIDFDAPRNYKQGEWVRGADESWFIGKKMYADQLIGSQGSTGYHLRMKGIPAGIVEYKHYPRIYNGEIVEFNLLENGKTSFFYEGGHVGCRLKMTRNIGTKEAKKHKRNEEIAAKKRQKNLKNNENSSDEEIEII